MAKKATAAVPSKQNGLVSTGKNVIEKTVEKDEDDVSVDMEAFDPEEYPDGEDGEEGDEGDEDYDDNEENDENEDDEDEEEQEDSDGDNNKSEVEDDSDEKDGEDEDDEDKVDTIKPVKRVRIDSSSDDYQYDLYNLTICNFNPFQSVNQPHKESILLEAATTAAQKLFGQLHELPIESSEAGPLAILPSNEIFLLPRFKKIPEPKPETKWEKFAREKGIKKQKRDRMVYDEVTGEYLPRFGYKGINQGIRDIPIVEVKEGQDPYKDPWAEERHDKKERVQKNQKNQKKNHGRETKLKSFDPSSVPGIPVDITGLEKKRGKEGVRRALQLAQHSTASMGRFDELKQGEPKMKLTGKKRAFRDNTIPIEEEKNAMKSQIRFIEDRLDKKKRGVTNSLAAYEGILPDAPSYKFKKEKGRGKHQINPTAGKNKSKSKPRKK